MERGLSGASETNVGENDESKSKSEPERETWPAAAGRTTEARPAAAGRTAEARPAAARWSTGWRTAKPLTC